MIKGKRYNFVLGEIGDELVEEYKILLLQECEKLNNPNMHGYKIARGEKELTDDMVFQTAICYAKEYLKMKKLIGEIKKQNLSVNEIFDLKEELERKENMYCADCSQEQFLKCGKMEEKEIRPCDVFSNKMIMGKDKDV